MATENEQDGTLTVENAMDVLIVLLYAPGKTGTSEPINGITRLQKLMFLIKSRVALEDLVDQAKTYAYEPYKMGPYSSELVEAIDELGSAGILSTKRLEYWLRDDADEEQEDTDDFDARTVKRKRVESLSYFLSDPLGRKVGQELWNSMSDENRRQFGVFKAFFNSLSLRQLLIFTYENFPEYTVESTIKKGLGLL